MLTPLDQHLEALDFLKDLIVFHDLAIRDFHSAVHPSELETARIKHVGAKGGTIKRFQKRLGALLANKPFCCKVFNNLKDKLENELASAQARLVGM